MSKRKSPPADDRLMTSGEVAEYLGMSAKTLAQWRWRRTGPKWSKVGAYVRYRRSEVDAYVDAQSYGGAA